MMGAVEAGADMSRDGGGENGGRGFFGERPGGGGLLRNGGTALGRKPFRCRSLPFSRTAKPNRRILAPLLLRSEEVTNIRSTIRERIGLVEWAKKSTGECPC